MVIWTSLPPNYQAGIPAARALARARALDDLYLSLILTLLASFIF